MLSKHFNIWYVHHQNSKSLLSKLLYIFATIDVYIFILQISDSRHVTLVISPLDALMESHMKYLHSLGIPAIRLSSSLTPLQLEGKRSLKFCHMFFAISHLWNGIAMHQISTFPTCQHIPQILFTSCPSQTTRSSWYSQLHHYLFL